MDDIWNAFKLDLVTGFLARLIQENKLKDFLEFAREQAIKDGQDTKEFMDFIDELEREFCYDDTINWEKIEDIVRKCTGNCECKSFREDQCIIIENEEMDNTECLTYYEEQEPKISISQLNNALSTIGVKLEFIEALNTPFKLEEFSNFLRFKVIKIE